MTIPENKFLYSILVKYSVDRIPEEHYWLTENIEISTKDWFWIPEGSCTGFETFDFNRRYYFSNESIAILFKLRFS